MSRLTASEIARAARESRLPSERLSPALRVMWLAAAGQWDRAHEECQQLPRPWAEWIHAHLHRQEGDLGNAAYWYQRAGKKMPKPSISIEAEWLHLTELLLSGEE